MNFKTTVILIILLAATGGYLFFTRESGEAKPKTQEARKLLDIAAAGDVTKVAIAPKDGKPMAMEKTGKDWRLTEPLAAPADSTEATGLIDSLVNLVSTAQLNSQEAASAKTGLDKPQFTVSLTAGSKTIKLLIGDRMAVGNTAYAKIDGKDAVEVIPADVLDKLDRSSKAYRDTRLVQTPIADIRQITFIRKGETLKLAKTGNDWLILEPIEAPADAAAVTDLLTALTGLKAKSFIDEASDATQSMRGASQLVISFSTKPSSPEPTTVPSSAPASKADNITLTFGAFDDLLKENVYVKLSSPSLVAKVPATALESFSKKPLDLRDKRLVDINSADVSHISIVTDSPATTQPATQPAKKSEIAIERRPQGNTGVPFLPTTTPSKPLPGDKLTLNGVLPKHSPWRFSSGTAKDDADENDVNGLLAAFHPLRVEKYLEKNPTTQPAKSYHLVIHTDMAGGAKSVDQVIQLSDRGTDQPLLGDYIGLTFEIPRTTLIRFLESDFKPKPAGANVPSQPPISNDPGFPPQ